MTTRLDLGSHGASRAAQPVRGATMRTGLAALLALVGAYAVFGSSPARADVVSGLGESDGAATAGITSAPPAPVGCGSAMACVGSP